MNCNAKANFLGKIRKILSICSLLSEGFMAYSGHLTLTVISTSIIVNDCFIIRNDC